LTFDIDNVYCNAFCGFSQPLQITDGLLPRIIYYDSFLRIKFVFFCLLSFDAMHVSC
jgi:hypothetical protein